MKKIAILGATGYTGVELIHYLLQHETVTLTALYANSSAGQPISAIYPQFKGHCDLMLNSFNAKDLDKDLDLLFMALPHGHAHNLVPEIIAQHPKLKIIDLSADFRLSADNFQEKYDCTHHSPELLDKFIYAIPELSRDTIKSAQYIANPGCYPTASILGLAPLAAASKLSTPISIDAKSGLSGAGKALKESSLFCEANDRCTAYNTGIHRHEAEMIENLGTDQILFSPHLLPQSRGILASIYLQNTSNLSNTELQTLYAEFYKDQPFIIVDPNISSPGTALVNGSNNCLIVPKLIEKTNQIVVFSLIDNLIKGASGQAIQNMNLLLGLPETQALPRVARAV